MNKKILWVMGLICFMGFFGGMLFHLLFGFFGGLVFTLFIAGVGFASGRTLGRSERRRLP